LNYKVEVRNSGYRQDYIADKIGVTPQFLCMCLNGKKKLPEKRKIMLHKLLKIN
jgi:hypothetical protein